MTINPIPLGAHFMHTEFSGSYELIRELSTFRSSYVFLRKVETALGFLLRGIFSIDGSIISITLKLLDYGKLNNFLFNFLIFYFITKKKMELFFNLDQISSKF